jgi:DNA-binding MarR family transcriptional regulator
VETRDELADAFITASRVLVGVAVRSIEAADPPVTPTQHRLLVILASRGPQLVGELAGALSINSSNATRHCDRLERKGLIERRPSAHDGRAVQVSISSSGRELLAAVTRTRRGEIARILDALPTETRRATLTALNAFNAAAHEPADAEWVDAQGHQ